MSDSNQSPSSKSLLGYAQVLKIVREFFLARTVLEVVTPSIGKYPCGDTNTHSLQLINGQFLRTSPEHEMKKLIVSCGQDIYQLGVVFRDEPVLSDLHMQDFIMCEWYRLGYTTDRLIKEVVDLLKQVTFLWPPEELSFYQLLQRSFGVWLEDASPETLMNLARELGLVDAKGARPEQVLDFLYASATRQLPQESITVVRYFPESLANQSCVLPHAPHLCDRFELFIGRVEIANGARELRDAALYTERLKKYNPSVAIDAELVALMPRLPDMSGVALGISRLQYLYNIKNTTL